MFALMYRTVMTGRVCKYLMSTRGSMRVRGCLVRGRNVIAGGFFSSTHVLFPKGRNSRKIRRVRSYYTSHTKCHGDLYVLAATRSSGEQLSRLEILRGEWFKRIPARIVMVWLTSEGFRFMAPVEIVLMLICKNVPCLSKDLFCLFRNWFGNLTSIGMTTWDIQSTKSILEGMPNMKNVD